MCEHLNKAKAALSAAREDDRPELLLEIARTQALVSIAESLVTLVAPDVALLQPTTVA